MRFSVNGKIVDVDVAAGETLLDVLRTRLGLTGTKKACGRGECGACTVLVDGVCVVSCVQYAALVSGPVETIERIAERYIGVCDAFATCGGFQCGFCTPGQVVRATQVVEAGPASKDTVRRAMSGNVCRCTGYRQLIEAVTQCANSRAPVARDRLRAAGG